MGNFNIHVSIYLNNKKVYFNMSFYIILSNMTDINNPDIIMQTWNKLGINFFFPLHCQKKERDRT